MCYDADLYPFGGIQNEYLNNCPQNYKFSGKERDPETGLDEFGARYYASFLGRFVTPDWAAKPTAIPYAKFGDPQTLNLYSYVENSPVNRADKDGHCLEDACVIETGLVVAAAATLTTGAVVGGQQANLHPGGFQPVNLNSSLGGLTAFSLKAAVKILTLFERGPGGPKPGSAKSDGAGKPFDQKTKDAARAQSGGKCVLCGTQTTREAGPNQSNIDHAVPRSRGGDNSLDNAQNTCQSCNQDKGTMTTEEYLDKQNSQGQQNPNQSQGSNGDGKPEPPPENPH